MSNGRLLRIQQTIKEEPHSTWGSKLVSDLIDRIRELEKKMGEDPDQMDTEISSWYDSWEKKEDSDDV